MCRNDELSWLSQLFILFAENSQILQKVSVIPILLTFVYLVALLKKTSTHHPTQHIITAHNCHLGLE
jgi:hypothetical protein